MVLPHLILLSKMHSYRYAHEAKAAPQLIFQIVSIISFDAPRLIGKKGKNRRAILSLRDIVDSDIFATIRGRMIFQQARFQKAVEL